MARLLWHGAIVAGLTALTQVGGLAWLVALALTVRKGAISFILVFLVLYGATWGTARATAPVFGRVAISCTSNGAGPKTFNLFYCVLNRAYVTPELAALLQDLAVHLQSRHPGARVLVLDGGFPFFDGFPLLPHLSHHDGQKVDLALWYQNGAKRSPLGYWAFEAPTPGASRPCAGVAGLSMRWNMTWLQPLMRDAPLDETLTGDAIRWLKTALPSGGKIFLEPHLADRLGVAGDKVRFQGCRAARHDDHIHIQL